MGRFGAFIIATGLLLAGPVLAGAGLGSSALQGAAVAAPKAFSLEGYFAGKSSATGSFGAINGVRRSFTVALTGKWDGRTLVLREDFASADGERDRKTWRFRKISPNQYRGTREDVVGDTLVTITGDTARFTYLVDLDPGAKANIVRFHDTMRLGEDGQLVNTAWVTKYGFPVARTRVVFEKP